MIRALAEFDREAQIELAVEALTIKGDVISIEGLFVPMKDEVDIPAEGLATPKD